MSKKTIFKQIFRLNEISCSKPYTKYHNCKSSRSSHLHCSIPNHQNMSNITRNTHNLNRQILRTKYNPLMRHSLEDTIKTISVQNYCTNKQPQLPKLMDFPQVVMPSMFKTLRNWILSNFIIMRYFDGEFSLPQFVDASKQAVELVSGLISKGDIDSLSGLVTPEVIEQVKEGLSTFTLKQRQEFAIRSEDIYFCFPYEVGVMFPNEDKNDGENQIRFVEITMCYHALLGLKEMKETNVPIPVDLGMRPEFQEKLFICNYRFIREFTKGVQDDWTINAINHFKSVTALGL